MNKEAIDKARVIYYGLFSTLFSFVNAQKDYESILKTVKVLNENPIDENSQIALTQMMEFLSKGGFEALKDENNIVFFSPSTAYIPVTASYYNEARDDGKKRLEMMNYVLKTSFRRDETKFSDAEDHISFVFGFIQKLIQENLAKEESNDMVLEVFENILNEMVDEFAQNLYNHENSEFYKNAAILLKVFIEVERSFLDVKNIASAQKVVEREPVKKAKKEFKPRAKRNLDEVTSL